MIILASQSPRRKKLLEQTGLSFSVQPSSCDESYDDNEEPSKIVQMLAKRKAMDVAKDKIEALIIGADTIVIFKNRILEKPNSAVEARTMLNSLSGQCHEVLTGVALIKTNISGNIIAGETFSERTVVCFGTPGKNEIDNYVASRSPMDKAGGYGIQDNWSSLFVERIEGDYNNVIGLPLYALYQHMKTFAPEFIQQFSVRKNHE